MKMIRHNFFWQVYFEDFEIWGCLLRIDAKLCCTQTSSIHGSSMAKSIFTIKASFDSATSIESVLLFKVHVESQIVFFKMHQRGNVKKGNMGIGKSFFD